jgi:hypothetical protein
MVGLNVFNKSGGGLDPGLAKRRALFPEGRGLGVGGKKKNESKRKVHGLHSMGRLFLHDESQKENPIHCNEVAGVRVVESR